MVNIVQPDVDSLARDFTVSRQAMDAYQDSEQQKEDEFVLAHEEYTAPLAEAELQNQNEGRGKDSLLMNIAEIPADIGVGLLKAGEEIAESVGARDNLFKFLS